MTYKEHDSIPYTMILTPLAFMLAIGVGLSCMGAPAKAASSSGEHGVNIGERAKVRLITTVQDDQGKGSSASSTTGTTDSNTDNSVPTGSNGDPDMSGSQPGSATGPYTGTLHCPQGSTTCGTNGGGGGGTRG